MNVRVATRPARTAAIALLVLTLAAAPSVLAQDGTRDAAPSTASDENGPLASGILVTDALDTSDLMMHLGVIGWGFTYEAEAPFTSVTVAVVSMVRAHPDESFSRTPLGGALTVRRPEPTDRADIAVLLDARSDEPRLTLRVGNDTSLAVVDPPDVLSTAAGTVRRPYVPGQVVPTDPSGRFILVEAYRDAVDGVVSTGDVADTTAYLAVEVRVE